MANEDINIQISSADETVSVIIPDVSAGTGDSLFEVESNTVKLKDESMAIEIPGFNGDGNSFGFGGTAPTESQSGYDPVNSSAIRAFDCGEYNMNIIANVLATLIKDLRSKGLIKL